MELDYYSCKPEVLKAIIEPQLLAGAQAALDSALNVDVAVTPAQLTAIKGAFSPRTVTYKPTRNVAHPVSRFIMEHLNRVAMRAINKRRVAELLPHPKSIQDRFDNYHFCLGTGDAREQQRWNHASDKGRTGGLKRCRAAGGYDPSSDCCTDLENCNVNTTDVFISHRFYDLTPYQVAKFLINHGAFTAHLVGYFPPEITLGDGTYVNDEWGYVLNVQGDRTCLYHHDDPNNGYVHRTYSWREWVNSTCFALGGETFFIEVKSHLLGQAYAVLNRSSGPVRVVRPLTHRYDKIYVRSLYTEAKGYTVPEHFVRELLNYSNTLPDASFAYSKVAGYSNGLQHTVKIGSNTLSKGWQGAPQTFATVVASIFVQSALMRYSRTQEISRAIKRLKTEQNMGGFLKFLERCEVGLQELLGLEAKDHIHHFSKALDGWLSGGLLVDLASRQLIGEVKPRNAFSPAYLVHRVVEDIKGEAPEKPDHDVHEKLHRVKGERRGLLQQLELLRSGNSKGLPRVPTIQDLTQLEPSDEPRIERDPEPQAEQVQPPPITTPNIRELAEQIYSVDESPREAPTVENQEELRQLMDISPLASAAAPVELNHKYLVLGDICKMEAYTKVLCANENFVKGGTQCGALYDSLGQLHSDLAEAELCHQDLGPRVQSVKGNFTGCAQVVHACGPRAGSADEYEVLSAVYAAAIDSCEGPALFSPISAGVFGLDLHRSVSIFLNLARGTRHAMVLWEGNRAEVDYYNRSIQVHQPHRSRMLGGFLYTPTEFTIPASIVTQAAQIAQHDRATDEVFGHFVVELPRQDLHFSAHVIHGVPGSGKTHGVSRHFASRALVVVPTRSLAEDWRKKHPKATVRTPHKAQERIGKHGYLIVDEVYSIPPHLLYNLLFGQWSAVLLIGDPNQIPALDFKRQGLERIQLNLTPTENKLVTHRCPQDVTAALARVYPGIDSSSAVVNSLRNWVDPPKGQVIVFEQADKDRFKGAITVHEAQGRTFPVVSLYVSLGGHRLAISSLQHVTVAISRHTHELYVSDQYHALTTIGLNEGMYANVLSTAATALVEPGVAIIESVPQRTEPVEIGCGDETAAALALQKITGHRHDHRNTASGPLPDVDQGKLKVRHIRFDNNLVTKRSFTDVAHCRMVSATSTYSVVHTLIGRYAKTTLCPRGSEELAIEAHQTFKSLFQPGTDFRCPPGAAELTALVEAINEKGTDAEEFRKLDFTDYVVRKMSFFQKDCNKFTEDETIEHWKPGQGISAWPKTMCALFGVWFRSLENHLRLNLKPEIVFTNPMQEAAIGELLKPHLNSNFFENDFSAFDSTQNRVSLLMETMIMLDAGMPPFLTELYFDLRSHWLLRAPEATLAGHWKKHSGEPGTMLFNTIWNMTVVFHTQCFRGLKVALFKGDDSLVACDEAIPVEERKAFVGANGLVMKTKFSTLGSYTSSLVSAAGYTPDIVRFAARLSDKNFSDEERIRDLQRATQDFLSRGCAPTEIRATLFNCAVRYNAEMTDVQAIYDFLRGFAVSGQISLTEFTKINMIYTQRM